MTSLVFVFCFHRTIRRSVRRSQQYCLSSASTDQNSFQSPTCKSTTTEQHGLAIYRLIPDIVFRKRAFNNTPTMALLKRALLTECTQWQLGVVKSCHEPLNECGGLYVTSYGLSATIMLTIPPSEEITRTLV